MSKCEHCNGTGQWTMPGDRSSLETKHPCNYCDGTGRQPTPTTAGVTEAMVEAYKQAYNEEMRRFSFGWKACGGDPSREATREGLAAALTLSRNGVAGWQTMESAPKDGTEILVRRHNDCFHEYSVVWWSACSEYPWATNCGGGFPEGRLDEWMPLSTAPAGDGVPGMVLDPTAVDVLAQAKTSLGRAAAHRSVKDSRRDINDAAWRISTVIAMLSASTAGGGK